LKLFVSPTGRVLDASVLKSSGHRPLDQAAMTAALGWTLYPAEKDGQPVPGWAEVDVPFRLID
jgi:protein TonB